MSQPATLIVWGANSAIAQAVAQLFAARDWRVIHFGNYTTPLEIFGKYNQPALRSLYNSGAGLTLPFGFGYRWQRGESTLLVALPRDAAPRALPALPALPGDY